MEFIEIKVDKVKGMLDPKLIDKATPRAINKTAKKARTAQSQAIRKKYNITIKRLDEELEKVSGQNTATTANPQATIRAKKLRKGNPGLQHYSAKRVKKGVSYKIRKDNKRKTRLHAFIPDSFTTQGVYLRKGDKRIMTKGRYKGKQRQPIVRQTGPSVYQMMKRVGIKPIKQSTDSNFPRLFKHEYERELVKAKR